MHKLLTGFVAASALISFTAFAQAECVGNHKVTASAKQTQESASVRIDESARPAGGAESIVAQAPVCAEGQEGCAEATNPAQKR